MTTLAYNFAIEKALGKISFGCKTISIIFVALFKTFGMQKDGNSKEKHSQETRKDEPECIVSDVNICFMKNVSTLGSLHFLSFESDLNISYAVLTATIPGMPFKKLSLIFLQYNYLLFNDCYMYPSSRRALHIQKNEKVNIYILG